MGTGIAFRKKFCGRFTKVWTRLHFLVDTREMGVHFLSNPGKSFWALNLGTQWRRADDLPPSQDSLCVFAPGPVHHNFAFRSGNGAEPATGGGCKQNPSEGNYLCPVNGMLGLCQTMIKNSAVLSCGAFIPTSTDQIPRRRGCSEDGQNGTYECPPGMMGLCQLYVKNKVVLSCKQK